MLLYNYCVAHYAAYVYVYACVNACVNAVNCLCKYCGFENQFVKST